MNEEKILNRYLRAGWLKEIKVVGVNVYIWLLITLETTTFKQRL
jgi:hypothetical protein